MWVTQSWAPSVGSPHSHPPSSPLGPARAAFVLVPERWAVGTNPQEVRPLGVDTCRAGQGVAVPTCRSASLSHLEVVTVQCALSSLPPLTYGHYFSYTRLIAVFPQLTF